MGFWGMLGRCGSNLALRRLEGQSYRFAAFFGPLEALFFRRLCRACRGRAGAGVAQVTFPPSGAGLGCLARALFGWFFGVCWGFVGQNWHSGVQKGKNTGLQLFWGLWRRFFCDPCAGPAGAGVGQGWLKQPLLPQVLGWGAWRGAYLDGLLGYAGALWVKTGIRASRRASLQVCSFCWASGGAFLLAPVQGLLRQGWGRGGARNLPSLSCWVGVPAAGRIWMGFWGMLGFFGS